MNDKKLNIYFAGSIRGGRDNQELYNRIIEYINKSANVLTEHIGAPNLKELEKHQSDIDIYVQDTDYIKDCDIVIAECTTPSLGVGYELAYAEKLHKPCYILYNNSANLSAMIKGNKYYYIMPYREETEIYSYIDIIIYKGIKPDKLYVIVNDCLDPVYACVQGGHAVAQYMDEHKNDVRHWNNDTIVYLYANSMQNLINRFNSRLSIWKEPDLNNMITAVAIWSLDMEEEELEYMWKYKTVHMTWRNFITKQYNNIIKQICKHLN